MPITTLRLFLLLSLGASVTSFATNNNPASIQTAIDILNERADKLGVQPVIRLGQQSEGGVVIWVNQSSRSGIVAALQNDADFEANNMVFFPVNTAHFGSYSQDALGGGYQNTLQFAPLAGNESMKLTDDFAGKQALLYVTNESGEVGTANCDEGVSYGTRSCLGGWYIPNVNEFKTMFNTLCGSGYELPSNRTYWTSSYPLSNNQRIYAINVPTNHSCDVSNLTISEEDPTKTASHGYAIRYIRQFR